jgi:AraC-like DNA-binding protein
MAPLVEAKPSSMSYLQLIVRRFGTDPHLRARILAGVGVTPEELGDPAIEITRPQLMRAYDNMCSLFGDGWMVELPDLWRPSAHGALGAACLSAPTVEAAMGILTRYMAARFPSLRYVAAREVGLLSMRLTCIGPQNEHQARLQAEGAMLALSCFLEAMAGSSAADVKFNFRKARPDHGDKLESLLGAKVAWGAAFDAALLPDSLLAIRSPISDPALHAAAVETLETALAAQQNPDRVTRRVQRLLAHSETGRAAIGEVAASLGMSRRTLTRRLAEAGRPYRELADAELQSRARRWLDAGVLSRGEIGERLGFADATSFSRACRRWFGSKPAATAPDGPTP